VSVGPGAIALTRMRGANSPAQERGQAEHAALRGAIERAVLAAEIGKLGGDVDDPARALPGHRAQRLAPDQEDAAQVDADQPVEVGGAGLEQRLLDQDAGVVDQKIETAEPRQHGIDHRQHLVLLGDVRLQCAGPFAAHLGGHGLDPLQRRAVDDRDAGALGRGTAASRRSPSSPAARPARPWAS
jgi:hypothetical protein